MCRHSLKHCGCGSAVIDSRRDWDNPISSHRGVLSVGALDASPGHSITHIDSAYFGSESGDGTRPLLSRHEWEGQLIASFALVDVDEVHTRGRSFNYDFVFLRLRNW